MRCGICSTFPQQHLMPTPSFALLFLPNSNSPSSTARSHARPCLDPLILRPCPSLRTLSIAPPSAAELIEAHAVDTYSQFLDENEEALRKLPPPRVAKLYYEADDM